MSEKPKDIDAAMGDLLESELLDASMRETQAPPVDLRSATELQSSGVGEDREQGNTAGSLRFREAISDIASKVLKIPPERLDVRENMSRYGVDSIIVTELIKRISDFLDLPIAPTVFFEARHLEELADILYTRYKIAIERRYPEFGTPGSVLEVAHTPTGGDANAEVDTAVPAARVEANPDPETTNWINEFRSMEADASAAMGNVVKRPLETSLERKDVSKRTYEPVAIIAMDGVFAESGNLGELEKHLHDGDDCIREVPADRWDWREVQGDPQQGEFTNVKYGGFAPNIDKFDPMFFGMSPREAALMDPQHRLFIQCVWKLIESAGYAPKSLSGQKVGMFIGINLQDYAHLIDRCGAMEALHLTSLGHMFCPNRLSFLLDIHGPSQVIDTACSSSLVALHRAVLSIQHENCEMAIAGGANLMITPDMHIMYSKVGMICEDGRCKTFSSDANGYARGDGVGAVLLKSLSRAEQDGDTILAVIRGSAENHGGMSTSLTAPNPKAQAELILEAHRHAATDPRSVGYIECHGTGTPLGDPIEINGLKMAFEELYRDADIAMPGAAYCGLGSVKSNIGHAETAAGIAGVIKAVLAIRNGQLYPTLHCDQINPMIEVDGSPFFVTQRRSDWERPVIDGTEQLRRAGVSSFGAGGSNAHVVIEEYHAPSIPSMHGPVPSLILLSAMNEARLGDLVSNMHRFFDDMSVDGTLDIADVAYTLQVGRDAMPERLAFVVDTLDGLRTKLRDIADGNSTSCFRGNVKRGREASKNQNDNVAAVNRSVAEKNLPKLAELWVAGAAIDWRTLYMETDFDGERPRRVGLPTSPFAKQRHWLPEEAMGQRDRRGGVAIGPFLHPLVHTNTSDLSEQRYSSVFSGSEFFLADHVVMGNKVLPGVAYLEMARAAIKQAGPEPDRNTVGIRLKNVVWARPFAVGKQPMPLHIGLTPGQNGQVNYRIYSEPENSQDVSILHAQGVAILQGPGSSAEVFDDIDLAALRDAITSGQPDRYCLEGAQCYEAFRAMGIAYGPGHQGLQRVYFSADAVGRENAAPQVLAELELPTSVAGGASSFVLHPGLMDSALQGCIGLLVGNGHALPSITSPEVSKLTASLPFALDTFELVALPPSTIRVWIRYADGSSPADNPQKLDIDVFDEQGRICVRMRGFSSRAPEAKKEGPADETLLYKPAWAPQPEIGAAEGLSWLAHRVVICDVDGFFPDNLEAEITAKLPNVSCARLKLSGAVQDGYLEAVVGVFEEIKQAFARTGTNRCLVQVLIPGRGDAKMLGGLSGLLKTANRESSRVFGQLVELTSDDVFRDLPSMLSAECRNNTHDHVRYDGTIRQLLQWRETDRVSQELYVPWKENGVYLITGGAGGLGLMFARQIASHTKRATVVLCGRSEANPQQEEHFERLSSAGLNILYRQLDIGQRESVVALVNNVRTDFGRIDGVLHCAGVLHDNFIAKKNAQEIGQVLEPKVAGTVFLDEAIGNSNLDFLVLFSSGSGVWGSAGQSDYAAANAFMDAFAHHRNTQVLSGQRHGHTVSINWPLWADGGMRMEPSAQIMMQQATGLTPLLEDAGTSAFNEIMAFGASQVMVMNGAADRIRRMLSGPERLESRGPGVSDHATVADDTTALSSRIEQLLLKAVAEIMQFDLGDLDVDTEWNEYGFDSITLTDFSNRLNKQYQLELTPTVFFEYPTIGALSGWLAEEHATTLAQVLGIRARSVPEQTLQRENDAQPPRFVQRDEDAPVTTRQHPTDDAVAIVGMSGCFPMADDLDAFWRNLRDGKDCITEIPTDRWDWKALYGDPASETNKTNIKWGGFMEGVGDFDARFFGISPREAELMDPQQRLLMQYAWKAIEDAGYSASSLSGGNTAIFIATASSGYGEMMAQRGSAIESYSSTGTVGSIGPNRMSYFLNVHGPSEPVETACSSSLVALHRALAAMATGDCDQAIVGGINLIISPETHISFNKAGMLCEDGRCKTFSKDANGYVRGEGVGMLFLKKLSAAKNAGDHIYGVIKGSAENHGGRGNSLTAPNPKAQADLLVSAYARAGVDPRTVSYIEAHGTGTELGDPIEINGLKTAFQELYDATGTPEVAAAHCGLGSVKTNIGHLELAAGIAGVIKVLLQLKHKTLAPTLHCEDVNPYIKLRGSPFYLVDEAREWTPMHDSNGRDLPRRAGVSSFGFGGVNAHVVIEEYVQDFPEAEPAPRDDIAQASALVVLSAKNKDRLKASAEALLAFIAEGTRDEGLNSTGQAQHVLLNKTVSLVGEILRIDPSEIDPSDPFDECGFEPIHRQMLQQKMEDAFSIEIGIGAFTKNHSITDVVTGMLDDNQALRDCLLPKGSSEGSNTPDLAKRRQYDFELADLAYTLQIGREAMDERFAVVTDSINDLEDKLSAFVEDRTDSIQELFVGQTKQNKSFMAAFSADEELQEAVEKWMQRGKVSKLLDLWTKGLSIDWEKFYGDGKRYPTRPSKISAPGYPFLKQRYWFEPSTPEVFNRPTALSTLHPLVHENVSTLRHARFRSLFTGAEFFLADHKMQGQKVLPGVAYLEMARAAFAQAAPDEAAPGKVIRVQDVIWVSPVIVEQACQVQIDLTPNAHGTIGYEISSQPLTDQAPASERVVHSQGIVSSSSVASPPNLNPGELRAHAEMTKLDVRRCYELFIASGLDYGPGHRGITELYAGDGQVLAKLNLPDSLTHTRDQYVLHPSLMDSALQACIGLSMSSKAPGPGGAVLALPFAVETVDVFDGCTGAMWAWVRRSANTVPGGRLQKLDIDLCDADGNVRVQIKGFSSRLLDAEASTNKSEPSKTTPLRVEKSSSAPIDPIELRAWVVNFFKDLLSSTLKFPRDEIHSDEAFESYGIDSMMVMELTDVLEKSFGPVSKTLFFEYQTLAELVDYFLDAYRAQLLKFFDTEQPSVSVAVGARAAIAPRPAPRAAPQANQNPAVLRSERSEPQTGALDVAVIGLSGRYPQSPDIEAYWENLRDGRDCITEVPRERWDWRDFYSEDRNDVDRHYSKMGGFIDDIDKFDPLFFNISPGAAEYMDPQERLFLEHAWMAMEDAGYRREDLQKPFLDTSDEEDMPAPVGVYAGVMYGEYQLVGLDARHNGKDISLANFYASIANRVSYALNLHGPSMAIDTMCSSSLTAVHLACQDLKMGHTDMAFAGGVNLSIHPNKYNLLSKGQFISSNGKCESFGVGGEGYVPSEGVGIVLLKRLADAERDGDHIYGVIKSSAINHGGKTNGYSVPNPKAQQMVIRRALAEAEIDPRAIGYIEAHGTGTKLGDPIELTGLNKAFDKYFAADQVCWLGSSKSNIGHSEAAAGIAGMTKVLLQMREGKIAPSLHSATLNPNIDFSTSPFQVNQQLREWPRPVIDGQPHRRVSGISSYGAGGANAHLIIEEYVKPDAEVAIAPLHVSEDVPRAIVLSARTDQQLRQYVENLYQFLSDGKAEERGALSLRDMAFTLQLGREGMPYRLACIATSLVQLTNDLDRFLKGDPSSVYVGRAKPGGNSEEPTVPAQTIIDLIDQHRYDDLVKKWISGTDVDWRLLYASDDTPPGRISLPTYPFAREHCWLALPETKPRTESAPQPTPESATVSNTRKQGNDKLDTLTIHPVWTAQPVTLATTRSDYCEHRVLFIEATLEIPGVQSAWLKSDGVTVDQCFGDYAVQLFEQIKDIFLSKPKGQVLLQIAIGVGEPSAGCLDQLSHALVAMLKTARLENPQLVGQLIDLGRGDTEPSLTELADILHANGQVPTAQHIRYRQGKREVQFWTELSGCEQPVQPVWKQGGVYLIVGGAGGLGLIFAREILRQASDVTLILTGRSSLDDRRRGIIEELRANGARVEYRAVDVADMSAVQELIKSIAPLNGIIQSAGIIRDNFILMKTEAEMRDVFASKVSGVANLDLATRGVDLDFFVLFSSLVGALGNPGQSDYAVANAFLDAYAGYRNRLVTNDASDLEKMARPIGRTLSINWPLWEKGGMNIDSKSREMMWKTVGLKPLQAETGIDAFYRSLAQESDQVMVLQGDVSRLRQLFMSQADVPDDDKLPVYEDDNERSQGAEFDKELLLSKTGSLIANMLSEMLKVPLHRIETDVPLEEYGIDSVAMMKLTNDLENNLGTLSKTLFFEYPTIEEVSAYLVETVSDQLIVLFELEAPSNRKFHQPEATAARAVEAPKPVAAPVLIRQDTTTIEPDDIAVIGVAGQFPQAKDVEAFWQNLTEGKDCITEVPPSRWDHRPYFDPDKNKIGKTYCKWGGFLDNVDQFDAPFFKVSPGEAELLDPQERLFLETVWNLLESSGYLGETLQSLCQSHVGVFAGSMSQQYHAFDSDFTRESLVALSSPSSIANRVSYFFDFHGPSIAIDTMCSSALVAVHMACESLQKQECKVAIAGGVNLSIHPKKYIGLSAGQMIGSHPTSTSFGDGDGYLPAEAVGTVLLKPLRDAVRDSDNILAVIKSSAINHGGQSNGYRVPNGSAQEDLIAGNFAKANIDPRTVSYVESAANGSPLGDAIELNALTAGFRKYTDDNQFCAIGAVKSNIGHAEAASGMSQLIKVILQMQHRQLVPTIKANPLNPNIDFDTTPFFLQRDLADWQRPVVTLGDNGPREYPLRASVSSFGAGGSNAHLIIEEFEADNSVVSDDAAETKPQLVLLSARTEPQLRAVAERMLAFVSERPMLSIPNLAYTLQTAREAMGYRLALVIDGHEELVQVLRSYLSNDGEGKTAAGVFTGNVEQDSSDIKQLLSGKTGQATLEMLLAEEDLNKLGLYWVRGVKIEWQPMYLGQSLRRLVLPTYPFDHKSYWLPVKPAPEGTLQASSNWVTHFVIDAQQSTDENIERYLLQGLAEYLELPMEGVSADKSFQDYGVDSMSATKMQRGVAQFFGITISARDMHSYPIIADLAAFAATQTAAPPDQKKTTENLEALTGTGACLPEVMLPLSEGQKGLWLLHQLSPTMSAYNVPIALRFGAALNIDVLKKACAHLLLRFPALGSIFAQDDGVLFQRRRDGAELAFEHERFNGRTEAEIVDVLRTKSKRPFDLEHGPLFRVNVISTNTGDDIYVLMTVHHICFDGRSAVLLVRALMEVYQELSVGSAPSLPDHPTEYGDFVLWQQNFMESEQAQAQLSYWKAELAGVRPISGLPYDYPRPATPGYAGASSALTLPSDVAHQIGMLAKSLQVNVSTVFLGALNLMLHRYSGDDDISLGMPTMGRPESRFDDVIGYFVNMINVRSRISWHQNAADYLKELQLTVADGRDNSDYPFPALLEKLSIDRDQTRSPLFQVMFAFQNFIQVDDNGVLDGALPMSFLEGISQEGSHDLALEVYQSADGFHLKFDYNTELFSPETIVRATDHYVHLLRSMISQPDISIAEQVLMSPEENHQIVDEWSAKTSDYNSDLSVVELFQRQCKKTPNNPALVFEGKSLSYRELDQQSTELAYRIGELGATDVAVCMERGPDMIVALFAIWKAGAVYVPIAPACPPPRVRHILGDSNVTHVISDTGTRERFVSSETKSLAVWLSVDELLSVARSASSQDLPQRQPDDPAYVIYTSGSTGQPKGVAVSQRAIAHHAQVMRDYYRLTSDDNVLQFSAMDVDPSLEQILPGLLCGATLVVRPDNLWSVQAFRNKVRESQISVIDVPPSYLHELLLDTDGQPAWDALASVRLTITGGDVLLPETVHQWHGSPMASGRLINAYGPTEATITSTVYEIEADSSLGAVPIGRPLPGESVYILDARGKPVPIGVPGELHIGGAGLAIGYLNQPELTRKKFIENPLHPGARLYKTGDRVRWLNDGNIAFLGRLDHQVKLRGFRIECGEVEEVLRNHETVDQAVVISRPLNGSDQLVAYVVQADGNPSDATDYLKDDLAEILPDYMIPAIFVSLVDIPMMSGGKVDRTFLMHCDLAAPERRSNVAPRTRTEESLGEIWQQILNVERIGVYDNFFDLGGHSLLAIRLVALVQNRLGKELAISSLFEAPDIARQAKILDEADRSWSPLVCLQPKGAIAPWFCVHAVAGTVLAYQDLIRCMGAQRPVYALQAPKPAPEAVASAPTIEALAALYITAIRDVQPKGPYHLGGWSMGGVIAYEMAKQLRAAGDQVATLSLIDSYTPEAAKAMEKQVRPDDDDDTRLLIAFAKELGLDDPAIILANTSPADLLTTRLERMIDEAKCASMLSIDIDNAQIRDMFAMFQANVQAMNQYVPGRYLEGATLFVTGDLTDAPRYGWTAAIDGTLKRVIVPGDHFSILKSPNVKDLSLKLTETLE